MRLNKMVFYSCRNCQPRPKTIRLIYIDIIANATEMLPPDLVGLNFHTKINLFIYRYVYFEPIATGSLSAYL